MRILRTVHRPTVVLLALVWALVYSNTKVVVFFWKAHASTALGFDEHAMGGMFATAAALTLPLLYAWPWVFDRLGRRRSSVIVMICLSASTLAAYSLTGRTSLIASLCVLLFANTAVLVVMNAYTAEMFPTRLRADGYAWSNNVFGRMGALIAPMLLGQLAGPLSGFSTAVIPAALAPLGALALILWRLPETANQELEGIQATTGGLAATD